MEVDQEYFLFNMKPNKIGLIHIATSNYKLFTEKFVSSSIYGFEPELQKIFYIFTDDVGFAECILKKYNCNGRVIFIGHEQWPLITLNRFQYIESIEGYCQEDEITHIFFVNSNAISIDARPVESIESKNKPLCFVAHPGFLIHKSLATFERRVESTAGLPDIVAENEDYVQGFFYGGRLAEFMGLIKKLKTSVDIDKANGITAIWHDESHLNYEYVKNLKDSSILLDSGYAYPQGFNLDLRVKIFSLDKSKYFNLNFK